MAVYKFPECVAGDCNSCPYILSFDANEFTELNTCNCECHKSDWDREDALI